MRDLFSQVLANLSANRMRSILTMFGIIWGIVSIILMTAIGRGMHVAQMEKTKALGQNLMIVWGGRTSLQEGEFQAGRRIRLKFDDYLQVRAKCSLLQRSSPELYRSGFTSRSRTNSGNFQVHGVYPEYQQIRSINLQKGRLINDNDNDQALAVCILGDEAADQLFKDENPIGQEIRIQEMPYTVIGVMEKKDQNSNYSGPDKRKVFVPYHTLARSFPDPNLGRNGLDNLIVQAASADEGDAAERQVREVLGRFHQFDPRDKEAVFIWNTITGARLVGQIFESMRTFLGFVGLITLALGGLGVTNIMLVSVKERTREIGLRKAVGATRQRIISQFFSEALVLTLSSGIIGLGVGWGLCELVNLLPKLDFFAGLIITPGVAVGVTLTLVLVGLLAGIYPALQAADMDPIESLRYE